MNWLTYNFSSDTKTEGHVVNSTFDICEWVFLGNENVTIIEILFLKSSEERFTVSIAHGYAY
jgi:hypothetical protein